MGGGTLHGVLWHHSFFNNKKPFNLLDYNEDMGHVVSNFVKGGKYDILHIPCARFSHPA